MLCPAPYYKLYYTPASLPRYKVVSTKYKALKPTQIKYEHSCAKNIAPQR